MRTRPEHFPLFDSMRGIAFLCAFTAHAYVFAGLQNSHNASGHYVARFELALRIFFLISAFLLYRPFVATRLRDESPPRVWAYAWRRLLRVVPAYWVAFTLTVVWLGFSFGSIYGHWRFPIFYGFGTIYWHATLFGNPLPQAWSLCVEAVFYVILPFYAAFMRRLPGSTPKKRLRNELVGAGALFALSFLYKAWLLHRGAPVTERGVFISNNPFLSWHMAPPAQYDFFAVGFALAALSVWYQDRPLPRLLRIVDRWPSVPWAVGIGAFVFMSIGIGLTGNIVEPLTDARYFGRHYLLMLAGFGLMLPVIFGDQTRGLVRRFLANRVLAWIGMVSYGCYLWHYTVLVQLYRWHFRSFTDDTSPYLWIPAGLVPTLAIAAVSWYLLERPILTQKRRVPDRRLGQGPLEPTPPAPQPQTG